MTERSKLNSGLREGEKITNPGKYFSESEKRKIVEEYLNSDCTKSEIWKKYTGCSEERAQLLRWIRQLGYSDKRPNPKIKKFTTDQKHAIIQEYLLSDKSKQ